MSEQITITVSGDKRARYEELLPQIRALVAGETDGIANLANISAALKSAMNFFWVGFYLVKNHDLVVGPFQGPVACTRIKEGRGVCGMAMKSKKTIIVPDVNEFPDHIACSTESKSEIVIPAVIDGNVVLVLDADSEYLNNFDSVDKEYLEKIIEIISGFYTGK